MIERIIIVGGGTAGWLTAGILASQLKGSNKQAASLQVDQDRPSPYEVILIESPDVPTIGVGEGTWPSMRSTLKGMGVSETDFIRQCDVSLKQGTRFNAWLNGSDDSYYHPFSLPNGFSSVNLANYWPEFKEQVSFANAVCSQVKVCDEGLSAKQITTPEYGFAVNYGYHLDAGKFAHFLQQHCTNRLGVTHILDHVDAVNSGENGCISTLKTRNNGLLKGDLFIDCTGFKAMLIGEHLGVKSKELSDVLFNDRALAVQVPLADQQNIASVTHSTALSAGWVWDIGLSSRRGVGYVYSSSHSDDDQALASLQQYLASTSAIEGVDDSTMDALSPKKISFEPQHRTEFWYKNCVAIGLSAGFVEPLEASALVLVETSAKALLDGLPKSVEHGELLAKRFNQKLDYHWRQIVDFLKLHYVLSQRTDSDYWRDHRAQTSIPDSLNESLLLWRHQAPWHIDAPRIDELFSSASFQYVLYGMDFKADYHGYFQPSIEDKERAKQLFVEVIKNTKHYRESLPTNRMLHNKIMQHGFQRI